MAYHDIAEVCQKAGFMSLNRSESPKAPNLSNPPVLPTLKSQTRPDIHANPKGSGRRRAGLPLQGQRRCPAPPPHQQHRPNHHPGGKGRTSSGGGSCEIRDSRPAPPIRARAVTMTPASALSRSRPVAGRRTPSPLPPWSSPLPPGRPSGGRCRPAQGSSCSGSPRTAPS